MVQEEQAVAPPAALERYGILEAAELVAEVVLQVQEVPGKTEVLM